MRPNPESPPNDLRSQGGRPTALGRAIEVVTLFEDTIVEARHFDNPRSGTVLRSTRALLVGGAVALAAALGLFLIAYAQVIAERKAGLVATSGGFGLDLLALLFIAGGVSAIGAGLLRLSDEKRPRDFTIGTDPSALFQVDDHALPAPAFPLLRSTGEDWELSVAPDFKGDVTVDGGKRYPIADLIASGKARPSFAVPGAFALPLPDGARARVDFGATTVLLRPVAPPRRQPVPFRVDGRALRFTLGTAAVALTFLALILAVPPDPKSLAIERFDEVLHKVTFELKPEVQPPPPPTPAWMKVAEPTPGTRGKTSKGTGGKMGKKDAPDAPKKFAIKGPADNKHIQLAKDYAENEARKSGVMAVLSGSHFASIFSSDSTALGDAERDAMGGLLGAEIGDSNGVPGGLGLVGRGVGGPNGNGNGTIGVGTIGTHGVGDGNHGWAPTGPALRDRAHHAGPPDVHVGIVESHGISKELIRRVIRAHLNEVKFCYDQQLQRNPDLYGRVVVQFTIGPQGQVLASLVQSSTVNNVEMEQCAAGAVRRWSFPRPEVGGAAMVSYPFVFNRTGQ